MFETSNHPNPTKADWMVTVISHRQALMAVFKKIMIRNKIMGVFSLVYLFSVILFIGIKRTRVLDQSFDYEAHLQYLNLLLAGRYPKLSDIYTACHFPVFYEMHLLPARIFSFFLFKTKYLVFGSIVFQVLIQIITLYILYVTCLLLIKNRLHSLICCLVIFTSLPVLHLPLNWNEDIYVFFLSCVALNVFVRGCLQKFDNAKVLILGVLFLIGIYFKITMLIIVFPIMAIVFFVTNGEERVCFMAVLLSAILLPLIILFFRGDYLKSRY